MKLALSGAGGYLGREVIDFLSGESSVHIHGLYSPNSRLPSSSARFVPFQGALHDSAVVRKWLQGCDAVLHLAERGRPAEASDTADGRVVGNLTSAAKLIDAMKETGVRRLIYTSSGGALYQGANVGTLNESSPIALRTAYSVTKFFLEKRFLALVEEAGWSVSILRVSNPYGIHQIGHTHQGVIGAAVEKLFRNEELPLWGSLTTAKDFIAATDVCRAFKACLAKPAAGIFNIGSGQATTLKAVFELLEKVSGRKLKLRSESRPLVEAERIALDCTKARAAFGWSPNVSLEAGLASLWRWRTEGISKRVA